MDLELLRWQLGRGSLVGRVVLRAFMLVLAVIVVSWMQMATEIRIIDPMMSNANECPLRVNSKLHHNTRNFSNFSYPPSGACVTMCKETKNLTKIVFDELREKNFLQLDAKVLCVGEGSASSVLALRELGFNDAFGVDKHPFFSFFKRRFVYELSFEDNHFDFVYTRDLDRVSVPVILVMEIERVLRAGGIGAMLVGGCKSYPGGLVRSATPVSSFLKSSDVLYACPVGSYTLVIFKKRFDIFTSFEHFQLPADCTSFVKNKPFMKYIEPLSDKSSRQFRPELSYEYLPKFMNISTRSKLVYINVGAGEFAKSSVAKMLNPYYTDKHAAFNVFVVDHKTSILSSFVKNPGVSFIYHPALSGDEAAPEISPDEHLSAPMDEKGFDFVPWFNETVSDGDFVVLMMKTKPVELSILVELFKTGAICRVDELFLRCDDSANCRELLKSLRKSGVYVHHWL